MQFAHRREAGRALATALTRYTDDLSVVVLASSPGSVPVAYEVAATLHAPLDVLATEPILTPGGERIGAVASGGTRVLEDATLDVPPSAVDALAGQKQAAALRRENTARGERRVAELGGRTVILVGEGLAETGAMDAAVAEVRAEYPARVVVALPVAAKPALAALRERVDELECAEVRERIEDVASCYGEFSDPSTDEVRELLARTRAPGQTLP